MDHSNQLKHLKQIITSVQAHGNQEKAVSSYRFDIFKGSLSADGKVTKIRSVGAAYIRDGRRTYTVSLKTFLKDRFYLLPNTKTDTQMDYVILTREPAQNIKRKYFWNSVGIGLVLDGANHGLMKLSWDVLADDLYMSLHPIQAREPMETEVNAAA